MHLLGEFLASRVQVHIKILLKAREKYLVISKKGNSLCSHRVINDLVRL